MDLNKFEKIVQIEFIESFGCFGHHPMQLIVITKENEMEMNALVSLRLDDVRNRIRDYLNRGDISEILISLDFPGNDEIPKDFVMLLHFKEKVLEKSLIKQYDVSTGAIIDVSDNSEYKVVKHIVNLLFGERKWKKSF